MPWRWVGERGLRLATGGMTLARYQQLVSLNLVELEDIIPVDGSILLILRPGASLPDALWVALALSVSDSGCVFGRRHDIPVIYDGADLPMLAVQAGLAEGDFIARHAAADYVVAFLGFQPGFPYLRGLPEALHAPRRASPRTRVPAGSVAIGGPYTGIYPAEGPGGWQLIGHTQTRLFDPQREPPTLLLPGDRVRFVAA
ncbi:MAG: 5-oxoprolinase subunit PxpB [Thiobacillus sp.]